MEEDDKGCPMVRMGVSGWEFLLVPAYPGCPGQTAVKRLLLLLCCCHWMTEVRYLGIYMVSSRVFKCSLHYATCGFYVLSRHLGWRNRRRFGLQKGGSQEHMSLITIMFCFNEFAFIVQVKHKINSTQILGFILICFYFTTGHFHTCVLYRECSIFPF